MSVNELSLETDACDMYAWMAGDKFYIGLNGGVAEQASIYLDRNQAYLLKLWLEEHLNDWT